MADLREGSWVRARLAALGVMLIAAAGCGSECLEGASRCQNNTVELCTGITTERGYDSTLGWRTVNVCLSSTCVAPPGQLPLCATSADPDPLCTETVTSYCAGNRIIDCTAGYGVTKSTCDASAPVCVAPPGQALMCALSAEPDPLCQGVTSYCAGNVVVYCAAGYDVGMGTCGTTFISDPMYTRCVPAGPMDVACVPPEAKPNDACPPAGSRDAAGKGAVCIDDVFAYCQGGLAIGTEACSSCTLGSEPNCKGALGSRCPADGPCAPGLTCHADSTGTSRCTAACDATDLNAVEKCVQLFVAGGPPPSKDLLVLGVNTPGTRMTCTAGFCEWK